MPRNQFDEGELFETRNCLESAGARVVVLSQNGQEAVGMKKARFQPQGIIIDWNKQQGITEKYHAVLLVGGKGAQKFLWNDPILPQILTDHLRAGKIIGAIGLSVLVLVRGALLHERVVSGPDSGVFLQELEACGVDHSEDPVTRHGRIITAKDADAARRFAETVAEVLLEEGGAG